MKSNKTQQNAYLTQLIVIKLIKNYFFLKLLLQIQKLTDALEL